MKKILLTLLITTSLVACNNRTESNRTSAKVIGSIKDSLPDSPLFEYKLDDAAYTVVPADIDVHYSSSDSSLSIDAGKKDGDRINIIIADVKHVPGSRGNAWRSDNTKLAGSDSLVYRPSVTFYRNNNGQASWNNFNDGFHAQEPKEDHSIDIFSFRQTGERTFLIKGRINTRVLKNVYESGSKDFNRDHVITAEFVIQFEDYWLQL